MCLGAESWATCLPVEMMNTFFLQQFDLSVFAGVAPGKKLEGGNGTFRRAEVVTAKPPLPPVNTPGGFTALHGDGVLPNSPGVDALLAADARRVLTNSAGLPKGTPVGAAYVGRVEFPEGSPGVTANIAVAKQPVKQRYRVIHVVKITAEVAAGGEAVLPAPAPEGETTEAPDAAAAGGSGGADEEGGLGGEGAAGEVAAGEEGGTATSTSSWCVLLCEVAGLQSIIAQRKLAAESPAVTGNRAGLFGTVLLARGAEVALAQLCEPLMDAAVAVQADPDNNVALGASPAARTPASSARRGSKRRLASSAGRTSRASAQRQRVDAGGAQEEEDAPLQ